MKPKDQSAPIKSGSAIERFRKEFPYDTLVSAHQDWTYKALEDFLSKELDLAEQRGREATKRAYCEVCKAYIDADTGERETEKRANMETIFAKRIPLSECECFSCLKDEFCQACEDFGHQKEDDE